MAEYLKSEGKKDKQPGDELRRVMNEIRLGEKEQEQWKKRADDVVKRARDEDYAGDRKSRPARFNILWSNIETTAPLYFGRVPNVQVDRRWKEQDPLGRAASQVWERATQFAIDSYDFMGVMKAVVRDWQLTARGTAWVRYDPTVTDDQITYQEVLSDHVHYNDFGHTPAKQWRNVRGVWRKIYLNKGQLKARFGESLAKDIPLDYAPLSNEENEGRLKPDSKDYQQARIYEYWDADSMCVYWLSKSYSKGVLDKIEDPLGLHDFFPTPKPLYGFTTTEKLIPVPDYCLYQDQALELDRITMKIALLQDALRAVGFFDATYSKELKQLYTNPRMNEMIPVANWQKLQAAGGIKGIAEWMEIKHIVEALTALHADRDKVKQDLYEITGIGDIIRGANSGQEVTATEVQTRGRFASLRVEDRRKDVERYARDLIAMHGEIISEHFEPEVIAGMCGIDTSNPEVQAYFYQALELLRNDPMRSFRLTLETDSMVAVDDALDKQKTGEFVQAFTQLLQGSLQVMQGAPVLAPALGEVMLHTVRRFNAGRSLENAIEQGLQGLTQMAQQAMTQQKPDPKMIEVQGKMQLAQQQAQQKAALDQQKMQQDAVLEQQRSQNQMGIERQKMAQDLQLAHEKFAQEMALERQKMAQEIALEREKMFKQLEIEKQQMIAAVMQAKAEAQIDAELKEKQIQSNERIGMQQAAQRQKISD